MSKYVYELNKRQLRDLYNELCTENADSDLLGRVKRRLDYIERIDHDFVSYCSDRVVEHSDNDCQRWNSFMREFNVYDFPFLANSTYRSSNRIGVFMLDGEFFFPSGMSLAQLDAFYDNDKSIYDYEGTYNALNYIRDRFYSVGDTSIFQDLDEKRKVCELKLGDIARYVLDIKNGTKLKLSVGDTGLIRSAHGTYRQLHPYQKSFIDAVAFGTDLEKLENGNYEDCKRLLYLPRSVKK